MPNKVLCLITLVLAGCCTKPPVVKPPEYADVPIPKVEPTQLKEVKWKLMNKVEMQKYLTTAKDDEILYVLDENNSVILLDNIQELRRYTESQQEVINYLVGIIKSRQNGK